MPENTYIRCELQKNCKWMAATKRKTITATAASEESAIALRPGRKRRNGRNLHNSTFLHWSRTRTPTVHLINAITPSFSPWPCLKKKGKKNQDCKGIKGKVPAQCRSWNRIPNPNPSPACHVLGSLLALRQHFQVASMTINLGKKVIA